MGSAPPDTPPVSQGSSTAMVARITLLVCIIQIAIGLQVDEDQRDKLEKVLEDTIQNTELDGDIVDNKTREGVAKVPSSQVLPFMRTVWNSLSSDSHMALGFGALLPVLGLMLPVMIFATIIPIIVLVMVSVFGFMSGALVLLPLLLTGLIGEGALPVDRMIEELFLQEFDGAATLEQFLNTDFEEITDKLDIEDSTDKAVDKIEEIPRYLRF